MNHKIACLLLVNTLQPFWYIYSENCKTSPQVEAEQMSKAIAIQEKAAYLVLEEMIVIAEMVTALPTEDQKKLTMSCIQCKRIMPCAEFAGSLIADKLITKKNNDLDELKKLLLKKNVADIQLFMKEIANKNQILCPTCKTCGWH